MNLEKHNFLLNPEITYLNFGSFGACPKEIFEDYQKWQLKLEQEPVQFIVKTGAEQLKVSRDALGQFINCDGDDLVYTPNPTYAGNIIAKGIGLQPGDQILTTNHEYGALIRTWDYYCKKSHAEFVQQPISLPIQSKEQILEEFWSGYTHRTKAIFISQISSTTALIFPVKEIIERAKELGLITIIDGAHVAQHIPLDIQDLDPDIYFGACHKWMCTPKGSSFLYVKKELQDRFDPLLISWGYESDNPSHSQFLDYHEYQGTRDFSAFLCTPKAIEFLERNNWWEESSRCKTLVKENYERFTSIVGSAPICPVTDEFLGQMASIPIRTNDPMALKEALYNKYKIEIPVMILEDQVFIRFSLNAFNDQGDLDVLANALTSLVEKGHIIKG